MLASSIAVARPPVNARQVRLAKPRPFPARFCDNFTSRIRAVWQAVQKDSITVAIAAHNYTVFCDENQSNIPLRASENGMGILISKKTKNRPNKAIVPIFLLPRHTFQL